METRENEISRWDTVVREYESQFNNLVSLMKEGIPDRADHVIGNFTRSFPNLQFVGWEALAPKDIPHGIALNGIYIYFEINFDTKFVGIHSWGHIALSKEESEITYLAATGMKEVAKARGVKWMRRSKYKDLEDLYIRMYKAYTAVLEAVAQYTGGYPYKRGIGFVKPQE